MKVVGLVSAYKEGGLVQGAIDSLEKVRLDDLLVYEGPAGDPLGDDVPESEYLLPETLRSYCLREGRWRTDARKRDEMLQAVKRAYPDDQVWGVWLDGDEILVNGEYLRDRLQSVVWEDDHDGSGVPTVHQPLRVIEGDGSIATTNSRLVRLDLVRSMDVSVSVVTNEWGVEEAWGNTNPDARLWVELWMRAVETGRMIAWPPLPCEPFIFHRSGLRHPLRRGLRMHRQEADELRKAGKL